jgi:hypothetical protein
VGQVQVQVGTVVFIRWEGVERWLGRRIAEKLGEIVGEEGVVQEGRDTEKKI